MPTKIFYFYNEILPKETAHDIYVVHNCASLAQAGFSVTLFCASSFVNESALKAYYGISSAVSLAIRQLPLVRKNNPLGISWNWPFFWQCQNRIQKERPRFVIFSVLKQGEYHLKKKIQGVTYIYETHQLQHRPGEKILFSQADLVTVTTEALKQMLLDPPFSAAAPIAVIPLATDKQPLPPCEHTLPLNLFYVGQLYAQQGVGLLLDAIYKVPMVKLFVLGGKEAEIERLKRKAYWQGILPRVAFLGKKSPKDLQNDVNHAHAFAAPFTQQGRMPYVAHTKLYEYAAWGRPLIAPKLPSVLEHFADRKGCLLFEPGNADSLAGAIQTLLDKKMWEQQCTEILPYAGLFTWKKRAEAYSNLLQSLTRKI